MSAHSETEARGRAFTFGLNPYGLTYHLGLQGAGGPRANPHGAGLRGLHRDRVRARRPRDRDLRSLAARARATRALARLRERLAELEMVPIVSSGLMMGPFESALRSAHALGRQDHPIRADDGVVRRPASLGDEWRGIGA